jgi:CRISPR-associated helicase Cas3/CRISPR-associated endonuclease Cas3-HD
MSRGVSMEYYAHSLEGYTCENWQLLHNHLHNVADLAAAFCSVFNAKELAYAAGLLHDIGKYQVEFQRRLAGSAERVDHKTAGSKEALKFFGEDFYGLILAYIISGHHGGLPDYGSAINGLKERLSREDLPDYSYYLEEIDINPEAVLNKPPTLKLSQGLGYFTASFFVRIIFSALVDADFLDTEHFMDANKSLRRSYNFDWHELNQKFAIFYEKFADWSQSYINIKRREIYDQCVSAASDEPGLFTLTAPTGSGKTIASLAFALRHRQKHDLQRIVYVIPYTSIIEQNARVFRNIWGDENILEHHSNFEVDKVFQDDILAADKMKLAAENWDMPLIATTNVQFFQSLFANKISSCRKLHNLAGSVIILDEAQMLPTEYLRPCLAALSELVINYNCTVVLCTATQPSIIKYLPANLSCREILHDPQGLYNDFRRVKAEYIGYLSDDDLVNRLDELEQALVIVNTRKHAQKLYEKLIKTKKMNIYHLSAKMCPKHRRLKLAQIKAKLKSHKPCIVVSTQLIEAGVDIDFPVVYRALAGIDSIAQGAGRSNREGKLDWGKVYVFESTESYGKAFGWQSVAASYAKEIITEFPDDFLALPAIEEYFRRLYGMSEQGRQDGLDKYDILALLGADKQCNALHFNFAEAAAKFKIIKDDTISLVIPFDAKCKDLIQTARYSPNPKIVSRNLQPYTISIYAREFNALQNMQAVECVADVYWVLKDCEHWYCHQVGLKDINNLLIDDYIQ